MKLEITGVENLPEIAEGDDLGEMIAKRAALSDGDVVVVAQKVVSKAEGALAEVDPAADRFTERARVVAEHTVEVIARRGDLVIVRTAHGYVCAHAGVDGSNVPPGFLTLLPSDPDRSAAGIAARIAEIAGVSVGVIVSDTFGRPWRNGQVNVALGVAGTAALRDHRGQADTFGHELEATWIAVADEVASAAELVMGKSDGVPVAVVRGLPAGRPGRGADLVRPLEEDLFRRGEMSE